MKKFIFLFSVFLYNYAYASLECNECIKECSLIVKNKITTENSIIIDILEFIGFDYQEKNNLINKVMKNENSNFTLKIDSINEKNKYKFILIQEKKGDLKNGTGSNKIFYSFTGECCQKECFK